MRPRIMYIESKAESLQGPARIGRVSFTKSGNGIYYQGREFYRINGFKANYAETGSNDHFGFLVHEKMGATVFTPRALCQSRSMRTCAKSIGARSARNRSCLLGLPPDRWQHSFRNRRLPGLCRGLTINSCAPHCEN